MTDRRFGRLRQSCGERPKTLQAKNFDVSIMLRDSLPCFEKRKIPERARPRCLALVIEGRTVPRNLIDDRFRPIETALRACILGNGTNRAIRVWDSSGLVQCAADVAKCSQIFSDLRVFGDN